MNRENNEKSVSKSQKKKSLRDGLENERNSWNEKNLEALLDFKDWLPSNVS